MKEKILIVEDDKKISRLLELLLFHEGYEVISVADGKEGYGKIKYEKFDLVLLDIMIPQMNGIELCRKVREFSDIPILIVSAKNEVTDKVIGLDLGADDYITKPFSNDELLARVRALLRKEKRKSQHEKLVFEDITFDKSTYQVYVTDQLIELSKKETELLEYFILNKGIVLDRDKILSEVWGFDYIGNDSILDVYVKYLRDKIEKPFNKKYIHTIRGIGFTLKK